MGPVMLYIPLPLSRPRVRAFVHPFCARFCISLAGGGRLVCVRGLVPLRQLVHYCNGILTRHFIVPSRFACNGDCVFHGDGYNMLLYCVFARRSLSAIGATPWPRLFLVASRLRAVEIGDCVKPCGYPIYRSNLSRCVFAWHLICQV